MQSTDHPISRAPKLASAASNRRILIVDDLAFLRSTVFRLLSRIGFADIVQAKDGTEALDMLRSAAVDCVLTDYMMPNVSGLELLRMIRVGDLGCRPDLPVVLLTGHAEQAVVEAAQALDASGVLVKPCSAKTLTQRLEHALATPVQLKPAYYYRQVPVPSMRSGADAEESAQSTAWLLRNKDVPFLTAADLLAKRREREGKRLSTPVLDPDDGGDQAVVQRRLTRLVPLSALQPGTVIAESLVSMSGKTLLTEGTVLSDAIIDRLRELGAEDDNLRHVRIYV